MKLKKIIDGLSGMKKTEGKLSFDIDGVSHDSKAVKDAYLFVAVKGKKFDGADYVNEAIDRGARAVILDVGKKSFDIHRRGATFIYVTDAGSAMAEVSRAFYGDVSGKMTLVGVTGTNGKTTVTYLIESLLRAKKEKTGVIGTINYRFGDRLIPSLNTTPGSLELYGMLSAMLRDKTKNCVLEISSHALDQGRVDTLLFDAAVFTNISSEHMDYHVDMENYLISKKKLFDKIKPGGCAIVNSEDPRSGEIIKTVKKNGSAKVVTFGVKSGDVTARGIKISVDGISFDIVTDLFSGRRIPVRSDLIGMHNVYNILSAACFALFSGMNDDEISKGIESLTTIPGRLERIDCGQDFMVYVDYAHTADGLENTLKTLRGLTRKKLIAVFGCGGDRDKSKRPDMGRISARFCDRVFITSDNPRKEDPLSIIEDIKKGFGPGSGKITVEADRYKAISEALREAEKGDIILITGKGHETYQVFANYTFPFDDREVARKIINGILDSRPSAVSG